MYFLYSDISGYIENTRISRIVKISFTFLHLTDIFKQFNTGLFIGYIL